MKKPACRLGPRTTGRICSPTKRASVANRSFCVSRAVRDHQRRRFIVETVVAIVIVIRDRHRERDQDHRVNDRRRDDVALRAHRLASRHVLGAHRPWRHWVIPRSSWLTSRSRAASFSPDYSRRLVWPLDRPLLGELTAMHVARIPKRTANSTKDATADGISRLPHCASRFVLGFRSRIEAHQTTRNQAQRRRFTRDAKGASRRMNSRGRMSNSLSWKGNPWSAPGRLRTD